MLDWNITEESNTPLHDDLVENEEQRTPRSRAFLYLLTAIVLVTVVTAGGLVWGRYLEGESALEQDLLVQIRAEEVARRFGQTNRITVLIPENAPQRWRERFASHFRTPVGETSPVEVTIEKIERDGEYSTVWVRLGAQIQRRAYRMTSDGWRRVPLESGWQGESQTSPARFLQKSVNVTYTDADTEFAAGLIADFPDLMEAVQQWRGVLPDLVAITIQPHELEPGVVEVYFLPEEWIALNSPQVVQLPGHWNLSGESAIRYAFAEQLLNTDPLPQEDPTRTEDPTRLPGASRFITAVRTVVALRWALSGEEYAHLVENWQTHAPESTWQSPFFPFTGEQEFADPFANEASSATVLLVADTFIRTIKPDVPSIVLGTLQTPGNWDTFFEATTGYKTLELEALAGGPSPAPITLPLNAVPIPSAGVITNSNQLTVLVDGQSTPVVIDGLQNATLTLPDGETWAPACAPLFGELTIEGVWHEEGLRLIASSISVPRVTVPARFVFTAPPSNTVVYLASGSETLVPMAEGMDTIVALTPDGERVPVFMNGDDTPLTLGIAPSPWSFPGSKSGMLLKLNVSTRGCGGYWLLRVVPGVGMTGAWLAPPSDTLTTLWDDVSGQGLLIDQSLETNPEGDEGMNYWWLTEGDPQVLGTPDGILPYGTIHTLRPGATQIAISNQSQPNNDQPVLSLIDLIGDSEPQFFTPDSSGFYLSSIVFSHDGNHLYIAWTRNEESTLTQINLTNGGSRRLWKPEDGAVYGLFHDQQNDHLYAVAYQTNVGVRLVQFHENEIVPLAEHREEATLAYVQSCRQGGIFYLTFEQMQRERSSYETDLRRLHRVPLDAITPERTLSFDIRRWEYPVMCP